MIKFERICKNTYQCIDNETIGYVCIENNVEEEQVVIFTQRHSASFFLSKEDLRKIADFMDSLEKNELHKR